MIRVMDVYNDLHEITDEVVRVFGLAGIQPHPSLVVGMANMVCILRYLEKHKISETERKALDRLVREGDDGLCHEASCPVAERHLRHP